jgi:nucleotide-binding universal stress UspA family protein
MGYLIVATDFSEISLNAAHYACSFAVQQQLDIVLLHCYSFPVAFTELPVPAPIHEVHEAATEGMDRLLALLRERYAQLKFTGKIIYGDLTDVMADFVDNNEAPELVVVGNEHSEDNPAWLDSTLLKAFRKVKFPVLAIPPDTAYNTVHRIGFAYDNKYAGTDVALLQLKDLTRSLKAQLHVFFAPKDLAEENAINQAAQHVLADVNPLYHVFTEGDVSDAIVEFTKRYSLDWLAVMPRHHGFFESLFRKSNTSTIINFNFLPLLALHENV